MTPEVESLFHRLADLPPDARRSALARWDLTDDDRHEIEELLAFDGTAQAGPLTVEISRAASRVFGTGVTPGSHCGPYRLVKPLGAGGMGAVYLAERDDGEVDQRVAVKFLNAAFGGHLEQQLLSERRLLARLSHPHIARFLDCGTLESGQPYFVMEYVDGEPIDRHCQGLAWRRIVRVFRQVCEAVAYAHANLIVHRDLKPGNILVDAGGQPKLIDFGIGKLLDLDGRQTQTAIRMLTPAYASPEQMLGKAVSTAADVYGLGATLYHLLAGRPPFETTSLDDVATREPAPLHSIRKGLPRDLSNIVDKAMRPDPVHRYASVTHLVSDLDALIDSRPVSASRRTLSYRIGKFTRRYWIPVTASAVAFCGLTGGLAIANQQLVVAQHRFDQVRTLANEFLAVDRNIREVAGMTAVRQHIARTSLAYLEALAAEAGGDPALALELARGYEQIATIQGAPGAPNLGDQAGAVNSFERGRALVDMALAADPTDPAALRTAIRNAFMYAQMFDERPEDAARKDELIRRGVSLVDRLVASSRFGPDSIADASSGYQATFRYYLGLRRFDEAERYARIALELARQEVATGRPRARASLGRVLFVYADVLRATGRLEESLATARDAGTVLDEEIRSDPGAMLTTIRRLGAYNREALALADAEGASLGRWAEAYEAQQRMIDGFRTIASADAADMDARVNLAEGLIWQAKSWRIRGEAREADARIAEAQTAVAALTDQLDSKRRLHASIAVEAGHALRARGRAAEARNRLHEAQAVLDAGEDDRAMPDCESPRAAALELSIALALDARQAVDDQARQFESTIDSKPFDVLDNAACLSWRLETVSGAAAGAGRAALAQLLDARRAEIARHWQNTLPAGTPLPWQLRRALHGH
jgi:hypothetical protein